MPKAATPAHIYLLLGEEDLLVEQALKRLLDQLIPADERALNLDIIYADEVELGDVITRVDTLPFFGQRRAVVIKDADSWTPPEQERLAVYLERGAPPSALILVASELDRRRKLYTTIRHARIPAPLAAQFWQRVETLIREFTQLPRSGDTVFGFAAGLYPTDHPTLPEANHESAER